MMRFGKCTVEGCLLTHYTRWAGFRKNNRAGRSASRGSNGSKGECKKGKAKSKATKGKKGKKGGKKGKGVGDDADPEERNWII